MDMLTHRRHFLKSTLAGSTLVSMGAPTVPGFLGSTARAAQDQQAQGDRILVVVQLIGGNDGLNTVVPHGLDGYTRARRVLRLPSGQIHAINKEIGLHPGMGQMAKLLESNRLAVIQGVGYPNPDRSHFRSMEIWETARTDNRPDALDTGWIGRVIDQGLASPAAAANSSSALPALHIGAQSLPLALKAKKLEAPSLDTLDQFRLQLSGADDVKRQARQALDDIARLQRGDDALLGFIRRSMLTAYDSTGRLESITKDKTAGTTYPSSGLANRLSLIASIIKAGFGTRIYYTSQDGYDSHANQLGSHAALLTELSDAVAAFDDDLSKAGHGGRVCIIIFSEFGRRVAENASAGTDHGAAAPVLLVGPVAKPGLIGDHPRLDDLDDGDLKHHTDFRSVYAALLQDWLNIPATPIIGEGFTPLPLFA
jgi:uncharacterized protein (DUF1501 family)